MRVIRLGTRGSALAKWQSHHVAARLFTAHPGLSVTIVEIRSTGDQVTDVPLSHVEGTGFFTATLEQALAAGEIDVAVHSYKDLPVESMPGLVVAAVPPRAPVEDVLIARDGLTLATLPQGARVGTCSTRRTAQVHAIRPDLQFSSLRGNVPTRVERVTGGALDAIVLARAGLVRLGLEAHITEVLSTDTLLPAPAQGALAVQCRSDDEEAVRLLQSLDDLPTRRAVDAERTVLHALGGGCSVPVGAVARSNGRHIGLVAGVFDMRPHGSVRVQQFGDDPRGVGERAASRLLSLGAERILRSFDKTARVEPASTGDHP